MVTPNKFLYPILLNIEATVLSLKSEYKTLKDKDIERCYNRLKDYFRKKSFNKPCEEPESPITKEQDLMDEILNTLEEREAEKLDNHLLNSAQYTNGENSFLNVYQIYVVCFNNLAKSVKLWRKNKTGPSYLAYIEESLS